MNEPVLLANIDTPDIHRIETYESRGGYETLRRVLLEMAPGEVAEEVRVAALRGRGGAGFPTAMKWSFLPKDHDGPIYFCLNADESEPGTFVNRVQMEGDPHQILEGLILSCFATGASRAYIYLRWEYPLCYQRMLAAVDECRWRGYLGENILGTEFSLDLVSHRGAAAYICGEETGLIESIEGRRAWPRVKPPFPADSGLFNRPTVVSNVETVACVLHILARGADWFRSIGTPPDPEVRGDIGSFGPKLFGISGHVNRPGCYEVPLGTPCRELIEEYAGGVRQGRRAKAVIVGGLSTGVITGDELDTPMDFVGPGKAGCLGLGTGGVVVLDETYPIIELVHNSCRFFASELCGQCTPCREGTRWAFELAQRIRAGGGRLADLDLLTELGDTMGTVPGTTICALADGAAWPLKTVMAKFRDELEGFVKETNSDGYQETEPVEINVAEKIEAVG